MRNKTFFLATALFSAVILGCVAQAMAEAQAAALPSADNIGIEDAVINVAGVTGKAVVSISTEHVTKIKGRKRIYFNQPFGNSPFGEDDPFRRFFDDFLGQIPDREFKQSGLGSGVIIDNQGHILTNEHVISNADKITVILPDGREFKGEVKGKDPRSDLAVIKIDAKNLPVASLGDSDALKIGQWVVAIGNPFAFVMQNPEPTVTTGVISALHRSLGRTLGRERDYNDLIQTDAAINPGNSGGPLVNLKGEVVGINVAIFSTSGGYQGIGFAIPINSAKRIMARLIEGKKISYGWLGVTIQDLNDDLVKYFETSDKNGVLVAKVINDSPAEKGKIKEGDIIRKFDGAAVNNVKELLNIVGKAEVGKKVKLVVFRDKKEVTLEVEIGERPERLEEGYEEEGEGQEQGGWRGLRVEDLNSEIARRFRVQEKEGVLVVEVEPQSQADAAGIVAGDIILAINKQPIKNVADFDKLTKELKGNVLVRTNRGFYLVKEKSEE